MTHLQLNLNVESLKGMVQESNLNEVAKASLVLMMNELLEKERDDYLKADAYERTDGRVDYRNGYYERELMIQIGQVTLRVPRTRNGEFSSSLFERYQRVDQSFLLAMIEMVINGTSTRKVTNVVEQLCGKKVSKSFVSQLLSKLDPVIQEWAGRPLHEKDYPYLFVDAMYIKVREHQKVVSKAVYIATALTTDGKRETLGLKVSNQENYEDWKDFLQELKRRGLQSPKLVISDAHPGLTSAIKTQFIGTSWQRCTVHLKRNLYDVLPKKGMERVKTQIRAIYETVEIKDARKLYEAFVIEYEQEPKLNKVLEKLEDAFDDSVQYMNESFQWHKHIRSTNSLERLNQEVRRRERVIRIFPNEASAFRLIGAVLMEYDDIKPTRGARG